MSGSEQRTITYGDILRARDRRDPHFADLVILYLNQADAPENAPEDPSALATQPNGGPDDDIEDPTADPTADDDAPPAPPLPKDAWTLARLKQSLSPANMWGKTADEKHATRRQAWSSLMAAQYPPPRLQLGDLLVELYRDSDADSREWSRAQLLDIFARARVGWGLWRGLKRIYKMVELSHDAEMFGILAWRLDAMGQTESNYGEISGQTFNYMKRRAWRYLRQLGQALPDLYPQFAVQVLRHYPESYWFYDSWVASQIWAHADLVGARSAHHRGPPAKLSKRAFDQAWKIAPEPLLRLLEDAHNDDVCAFAIRSLEADFPETLRDVDARWLARIGKKPLASVHTFVVSLLEQSPELHQSKLRQLGLHDMVVGLLRSQSDKACAYAVAYAKSHAPDIAADALLEIAEHGLKAAVELAKTRLGKLSPQDLGMPVLARMLTVRSLAKLARDKWNAGFKPRDLDAELYVALANGSSEQQDFIKKFFKSANQPVPAAFLRAQIADESMARFQLRKAMQELGNRKAADIGVAWIQDNLLDHRLGTYIAQWLRRGILRGDSLDVEWLKGLVMRPSQRPLALELLGNKKFVSADKIGLPWLLAMARQADERLSQFAHRYLLEHFAPQDFAPSSGDSAKSKSKDAKKNAKKDDSNAGIDRLWSLLGSEHPEPVRRFAATYLKVHHPDLGPTMDEARQLGIKPKLPLSAYGLARVRACFHAADGELRRLAVAIGRHQLVRWNEPALVYQLAASPYREARALAAQALLHVGDSDADPKLVPPVDWLSSPQVFALAESQVKATREIALTLIRRHYSLIGGAHKLAWLMESPDREVRLFAVRLLWDKHRPSAYECPRAATGSSDADPGAQADAAADAQAAGDTAATASGSDAGGTRTDGDHKHDPMTPFPATEALQQFLRTILFGLPPGRMERRERTGDALPDRPLPASVAKRRLIDVVRDMGVEDRDFAAIALLVLAEFMQSQAKGEWHRCVSAMAHIRNAYPELETALPQAQAH